MEAKVYIEFLTPIERELESLIYEEGVSPLHGSRVVKKFLGVQVNSPVSCSEGDLKIGDVVSTTCGKHIKCISILEKTYKTYVLKVDIGGGEFVVEHCSDTAFRAYQKEGNPLEVLFKSELEYHHGGGAAEAQSFCNWYKGPRGL